MLNPITQTDPAQSKQCSLSSSLMTIGFFLSRVQSTELSQQQRFPLSNSLFKSHEKWSGEIMEGYLCTKAGPKSICFYSEAMRGDQPIGGEEIQILWQEPWVTWKDHLSFSPPRLWRSSGSHWCSVSGELWSLGTRKAQRF